MDKLKRRISFIMMKILCLFYGYVEIIIIVATISYSIFVEHIIVFIIMFLMMFLLWKKYVVARKGCLRIIKCSNKYELSMCNGFSRKSRREILEAFQDSFQRIFDKKIIEKLKGEKIYINTHNQLARGIIKMLYGYKVYNKEMFYLDVKNGYVDSIVIRKLNSKKNIMLASSYPIWPNEKKLIEFEKANKLEEYYELIVPIEVIAGKKLSDISCEEK